MSPLLDDLVESTAPVGSALIRTRPSRATGETHICLLWVLWVHLLGLPLHALLVLGRRRVCLLLLDLRIHHGRWWRMLLRVQLEESAENHSRVGRGDAHWHWRGRIESTAMGNLVHLLYLMHLCVIVGVKTASVRHCVDLVCLRTGIWVILTSMVDVRHGL